MVKLHDIHPLKNDSIRTMYYDIQFVVKVSLISFIHPLTSIESTITRIDENL